MELTHTHYFKPLLPALNESNILSENQHSIIFRNLESLLIIEKQFLASLETLIANEFPTWTNV